MKRLYVYLFLFLSACSNSSETKNNGNNHLNIDSLNLFNYITLDSVKYKKETEIRDKYISKGYKVEHIKEGRWDYYTKDNLKINSVFFEAGKPVLRYNFDYNINIKLTNLYNSETRSVDSIDQVSVYRIINDREVSLGGISYRDDIVLNDYSNFYVIDCPDSVKYLESFRLDMQFYTYDNYNYKLIFGEFKPNFNFLNPEKTDTVILQSNKLSAEIQATQRGILRIRAIVTPYSDRKADGSFQKFIWPVYHNVYIY